MPITIDIVGLVAIAALVVSLLSLILTQRHQGKIDTKTDTSKLARMETTLAALSETVGEIKTDTKSLLERVTRLEEK